MPPAIAPTNHRHNGVHVSIRKEDDITHKQTQTYTHTHTHTHREREREREQHTDKRMDVEKKDIINEILAGTFAHSRIQTRAPIHI